MKNNDGRKPLALVFCGFRLFLPALLKSRSDLCKSKTTSIVRNATGSSGDLRVRAMVAFLEKHSPGISPSYRECMPARSGRNTSRRVAGNSETIAL
jgi:hypothetical protein